MQDYDSKKADHVLSDSDMVLLQTLGRRNFLMYSGVLAATLCLGGFFPCEGVADSGMKETAIPVAYPIDPNVATTVERTLLFAAVARASKSRICQRYPSAVCMAMATILLALAFLLFGVQI